LTNQSYNFNFILFFYSRQISLEGWGYYIRVSVLWRRYNEWTSRSETRWITWI